MPPIAVIAIARNIRAPPGESFFFGAVAGIGPASAYSVVAGMSCAVVSSSVIDRLVLQVFDEPSPRLRHLVEWDLGHREADLLHRRDDRLHHLLS